MGVSENRTLVPENLGEFIPIQEPIFSPRNPSSPSANFLSSLQAPEKLLGENL